MFFEIFDKDSQNIWFRSIVQGNLNLKISALPRAHLTKELQKNITDINQLQYGISS